MTISPKEPPVDYLSQGAGAMKQVLIDPLHNVWILNCAGKPSSGDGNGWVGVGTLAIDHTTGALYQNIGTQLATVWSTLEATGSNILFTSANALTAHSGGGKASALVLTAQINNFTTVAGANDSALLPPAVAGGFAVILNNGASNLALYGAGTDTINAAVTATQFTVLPGTIAVFYSPIAGKWYSGAQQAAASQAQPSAPTAPANTGTFFMQGIAGAITPTKSGRVLLMISGNLTGISTTAGDGIKLQLSYGTGAAPVNAAALTGTQVGSTVEYTNPTTVTAADINVPFSMQAYVSGLALNTAAWIDLAAESVGTISKVALANLSVTAVEL